MSLLDTEDLFVIVTSLDITRYYALRAESLAIFSVKEFKALSMIRTLAILQKIAFHLAHRYSRMIIHERMGFMDLFITGITEVSLVIDTILDGFVYLFNSLKFAVLTITGVRIFYGQWYLYLASHSVKQSTPLFIKNLIVM